MVRRIHCWLSAMSDAAAAGEESLRRAQLEIEEQLGLANAEVVRAQEEVVSLRAKHGCAVATLTLRSAELSKEENRVLLLTGQLASLRDAKDAALATVATQEDEIAAAHAHCSALSEQMELASAELRRQRDAAGSEANERSKQLERASQLFESTQAQRLPPDVINNTALISACGNGVHWQRAAGLIAEMQSHGLQPIGRTHSAAISACKNG